METAGGGILCLQDVRVSAEELQQEYMQWWRFRRAEDEDGLYPVKWALAESPAVETVVGTGLAGDTAYGGNFTDSVG